MTVMGSIVPNKNIMVGILLAETALLKSPYVKRYKHKEMYA
jgi:hypothetical protein